MADGIFLAAFAALLGGLFAWAFRALPRERWQVLAAIPLVRGAGGHWRGMNLLYYGLFQANAYAMGLALFLILAGALGIPFRSLAVVAATLLALCVPAARVVARLVEGRWVNFTVGGAVFVGVLAAPWIVWAGRWVLPSLGWSAPPILPTLAALGIAYCVGEGAGRLACISFGCCYGRSLADFSPAWQRALAPFAFRFAGATKKIAYAGGMEHQPVLPVQAATAVVNTLAALVAAALFLAGHCRAALLTAGMVNQLWRAGSEWLRADDRGKPVRRGLSAYQVMALLGAAYTVGLGALLPDEPIRPDVTRGLAALWAPGPLLFLECVWLGILAYTGRSQVTGSSIAFHVHPEHVHPAACEKATAG